ncbi:MAG: hypothetical protein ACRYHQ_16120 [Janthinobacterium lividum]
MADEIPPASSNKPGRSIFAPTTDLPAARMIHQVSAQPQPPEAEPVWIGRHYPGEGFATLRCGKASFRIGYTALHVLGVNVDRDSAYRGQAEDFMRAIESCRDEASKGERG